MIFEGNFFAFDRHKWQMYLRWGLEAYAHTSAVVKLISHSSWQTVSVIKCEAGRDVSSVLSAQRSCDMGHRQVAWAALRITVQM